MYILKTVGCASNNLKSQPHGVFFSTFLVAASHVEPRLMNGGAASSDESEDSGSGAEMEQLNLEAVAVKQQMMDYGRVFVVGIPVKKFRRCVCLVRILIFFGGF